MAEAEGMGVVEVALVATEEAAVAAAAAAAALFRSVIVVHAHQLRPSTPCTLGQTLRGSGAEEGVLPAMHAMQGLYNRGIKGPFALFATIRGSKRESTV